MGAGIFPGNNSRQELEMLSRLAEVVSKGGNTRETHAEILKRVVNCMGGNFGYIYLVDKNWRTISLSSEYFTNAKPLPESSYTVELDLNSNKPVHHVIQSGEGMIVPSNQNDHSLKVKFVPCGDFAAQFGSSVLAPLKAGSKTIGVICISTPKKRMFRRKDIQLLEMVGNILGVALSNAILIEDLRNSKERLSNTFGALENAREAERKRISLDLHDGAGQALTALSLHLKVLQDENDIELIHTRLRSLSNLTVNTLDEIRSITVSLRAPYLLKGDLSAALRNIIEECSTFSGIAMDFITSGTAITLDAEQERVIYRAVQEGITNIIRHSMASRAVIMLCYTEKELQLEIKDNGIGLQWDGTSLNGSGLSGIAERAASINGLFTTGQVEGGGSKLHITIPLPEKAAAGG